MPTAQRNLKIDDIEFTVIFSARRTISIGVHPDSSVIVRAPYLTSVKKISRIITEKHDWVVKHRENYRRIENNNLKRSYSHGQKHLYRGHESVLVIEKSVRPYVKFFDSTILLGTEKNEEASIRKLLYQGYKIEAVKLFPELLQKVLNDHPDQNFKPKGLRVRTMKRRWGSCSNKGIITLSTELIKLSDLYIEYVINHELCHLKHHNHGPKFYALLTEVFPDWKPVRKGLRQYIQ